MSDIDMHSSDSETNDSDEELQEAFANGLLKPGLNIALEKKERIFKNNVSAIKRKSSEIQLSLNWIERLDLVNAPAPLAPELALQLQEQEIKRAKQLKNNAKLPQIKPSEDPVLNDFRRETIFHRQAQAAVLDGIAKLHSLNVVTKRPDDYFAQMAKSDEHMQKIRSHLVAKQAGQAKSERVKQIREQRKMGKELQKQAKVQRQTEKKEMLDQVKKYRKGMRDDLDFLENDGGKSKNKGGQKMHSKRAIAKKERKEGKFGFGGKKKGMKSNTKDSAADVSEYRRPNKQNNKNNSKRNTGRGKPVKRLGKSKRVQNKSKGRK